MPSGGCCPTSRTEEQGHRCVPQRLGLALGVSCAIHCASLWILSDAVASPSYSRAAASGVAESTSALIVSLSGAPDRSVLGEVQDEVPSPLLSQTAGLTPEEVQEPLLGLTASEYFPVNELDVPPQPLKEVTLPEYQEAGTTAKPYMVLVLYLDTDGVVKKTEIEASDIPSDFQDKIVEAFRNTPFSPGEKNGEKANVRLRIEVSYE